MTDERIVRLTANAEVQIEGSAAKAPRVYVLAYTGGVMDVPGYGPVAIDLSGVEAAASIPILIDHDSSIDGIAGHGKPLTSTRKLAVEGSLSLTSPAAQQVLALAKEGFRFQASVGFEPSRTAIEKARAGEEVSVNGQSLQAPREGLTVVRAGKLREVSIVALGADDGTEVSIAAAARSLSMNRNHRMSSETNVALELDRVRKIDAACRGNWATELRPQVEEIRAKAIDEGASVEDVHEQLLRLIRGSRGNGPAIHSHARSCANQDVLTASLISQCGLRSVAEKLYSGRPDVLEAAGSLSTVTDLCRAALQIDRKSAPSGSHALLKAGWSTTSLPNALGNAANKILEDAYRETPATWRSFATVKDAANFHPHLSIRPTTMDLLEQVGSGGEVKYTSIDEQTLTWRIDTYARNFRTTRQNFINDDLNFLQEVPVALARAAARKLSDLVYGLINANTGSHFDAGNGNYFNGTTTNLQISSLATAIGMMRTQRTTTGDDLDIQPAVLVVPPELQATAQEVLQSEFIERNTSTNDRQPTGNALRQAVRLEVEQRLSNTTKFSGASATAWYLFASPIDLPLIVGFLNGLVVPTIEYFGLDSDQNTLGAGWRVYHDFGVAFGDPKAAVKSKGAA